MTLTQADTLALAVVPRGLPKAKVIEFDGHGAVVGYTESYGLDDPVPSVLADWRLAFQPWVSSYGFDLEYDLPDLSTSLWFSPRLCAGVDSVDRVSDRRLSQSEFLVVQRRVERYGGFVYPDSLLMYNVFYLGISRRRQVELRAVYQLELSDFDAKDLRLLGEAAAEVLWAYSSFVLKSESFTRSGARAVGYFGQRFTGGLHPGLARFFLAHGLVSNALLSKLLDYQKDGGFIFWKLCPVSSGLRAKFYVKFA